MNRHLQNRFAGNRHSGGFSLVEVSLAVAILGIVVVGMMALLPAGMGQFQAAMDATVSAQIAQRVITDAEQSEFKELLSKVEKKDDYFYVLYTRYFDQEGNEIPSADGTAPTGTKAGQVVYVARARGSQPGPSDTTSGTDSFTSLPSASSPRHRPRASSILTVQVALNPNVAVLPTEPNLLWKADAAPMNTYTVVLTRSSLKQ